MDCSRYIPLYLKQYKDIVEHIPRFLSATTNCGYRIPDQIKKLLEHVKETEELVIETTEVEHKMNFFLERLKTQVKNLLTGPHLNCCQGECSKVRNYFLHIGDRI